jgi:hypothetical protein
MKIEHLHELPKEPGTKSLNGHLEQLATGPRATALRLMALKNNAPEKFNSLHLSNLAIWYWRVSRGRPTPASSTLKRELNALSIHAEKLAEGLGKLPIAINPPPGPTFPGFNPGDWCMVMSSNDENEWRCSDRPRLNEFVCLSMFLKSWADSIGVIPTEVRRPPVRHGAEWNDETGLALNIMAACDRIGCPKGHALPIAKAVIAWAADPGASPKRLGIEAWKLVQSHYKKSKYPVAD